MTPAARDTARRLLVGAMSRSAAPGEVAEAANLLFTQLHYELGRWIGGTGYRALLGRAFASVRTEHPALEGVTGLGGEAVLLEEKVRIHGAGTLAAGIEACLGNLVDLLGRIIGAEMAVQLVNQIRESSPRGVMSRKPEGGRDDD